MSGSAGINLRSAIPVSVSTAKACSIYSILFFRSSDVISKHIEGSGLGLAIVKNIVDYKGGTISVTSRQGEGTTFTVTLPLHFDTAAEHPVEKPTHTFGSADFDFSGKSLLLAEDHPINQKVAELILEKTGAAVTIVENGLQCTELFTGSAKGQLRMLS